MTATAHLQLVVNHWPDLHALRTSRPHDAWPPPSLNTYLRSLEEYDPADHNTPMRLHVVDVARTVEAALVDLADQTAATIQRPVFSTSIGRGWSDDIHRAALLLAARDSASPHRWRYHGQRTAPEAAAWLLARVEGRDGPFRPLNRAQLDRITTVAAGAAERITHALGISRRTHPLTDPCLHCRGHLELHGGDGHPPAVKCADCGRTWTEENTA